MTPEERETLLAGYALGTLSAPDALDAERLIRSDPDAAEEYDAYRELADLIALSVPLRHADPSLRQRVLEAARRERSLLRRRRLSRRHLPVAALAAALALVVLWAVNLQQSIDSLRQETSLLTAVVEAEVKRIEMIDMANRAVAENRTIGQQLERMAREQQTILAVQADPDALRIELQPMSAGHGARGQLLWSDSAAAGIVIVHDMPPLPLGANYKVWLEQPGSPAILVSTFLPDEQNFAQVVLQPEGVEEPIRLYITAGRAGDASRSDPIVLRAVIDRDAVAADGDAAADEDGDSEADE